MHQSVGRGRASGEKNSGPRQPEEGRISELFWHRMGDENIENQHRVEQLRKVYRLYVLVVGALAVNAVVLDAD